MKLIFGLCYAMILISVILGSAGMGQTTARIENVSASQNSFSAELSPPDHPKARLTEAERISLLEEALRRQTVELESMRQMMQQQQLLIQELSGKVGIVPQRAQTAAVPESANLDGAS